MPLTFEEVCRKLHYAIEWTEHSGNPNKFDSPDDYEYWKDKTEDLKDAVRVNSNPTYRHETIHTALEELADGYGVNDLEAEPYDADLREWYDSDADHRLATNNIVRSQSHGADKIEDYMAQAELDMRRSIYEAVAAFAQELTDELENEDNEDC